MPSILTLNGNRSEIRPRYPVSINNTRIAKAININGQPSIDTVINGLSRPPVPSTTVFYAPLSNSALSPSSFSSLDADAHTCTVTGALWRTQGRYFDGNDDVITLDNDTGFPSGAAARWFLIWVRLDALKDYQAFLEYGNRAANSAILFCTASAAGAGTNKLVVGKYGADAGASTSTISASAWTQVGFSFDGTQTITYLINGASAGTGTLAGINTVLNHCYIGDGWNAGDNLDGYADAPMLGTGELTVASASQIYEASRWRYV